MGEYHHINTRAEPTTCPRCGQLRITATDEGITHHAELPAITAQQELQAILTGHLTFNLTTGRNLITRDEDRLKGKGPPGTIHAQHKCPPPQITPIQLTLI
jgi:hypothetical protein